MVSLIQLYFFQRGKLVNLRVMCRVRLLNISERVDGDPWRKTILCVKRHESGAMEAFRKLA